jgi:hypothetical protein
MGWFKHSTDAKNDEKIRSLAKRLKRSLKEVYAEWFWFLECANKEGDCGWLDLANGHVDADRLAGALDSNRRGLQNWLTVALSLGLIEAKIGNVSVKFPLPKGESLLQSAVAPAQFTQYVGDYFARKIRKEQEGKYLAERVFVQGTDTSTSNGTSNGQSRSETRQKFSSIYSSSLKEEKKEEEKEESNSSGMRVREKDEAAKEIQKLWKLKYHRKMRFFPKDATNLETKIRQWDAATVLKAYREYLCEANDYLKERQHPFGIFIKQFDFYVVEETPQTEAEKSEAPTMVEFEGRQVPEFVRDQIVAERADAQRKIDEREREEQEGLENVERTKREGF